MDAGTKCLFHVLGHLKRSNASYNAFIGRILDTVGQGQLFLEILVGLIVLNLTHEVEFLKKHEHCNPQDSKNDENSNCDQQHVECVENEASKSSHVGSNCLFVDVFVAKAIKFSESKREKEITSTINFSAQNEMFNM